MATFYKNPLQEGVHKCGFSELMLNSSGPQKCLNNIHPIKATKLLVDGELVDSVLGNVNACINPSNGELIVTLPSAGAADLSAAINAARTTFDTTNWPRISSSHRGDYISRLAELLLERKSLLTYLQAIDGGVTRTNSRTDIDEAVDILIQQSYAYRQKPPYPDFHYEKKSKETFNETKVEPESIASSPKSSKRRSPGQEEYATNATASPKKDFHHTLPVASGCGVVLAIISSRGPYLSSLAQVIAPAVVAGESLILLVSEDAPLVALELAALVYQINFPKGSIQVLTGSFGTEGMRVSHFVQHININKVIIHGRCISSETLYEVFPHGISLPLLLRMSSAHSPWRLEFLGDADSCEPIPTGLFVTPSKHAAINVATPCPAIVLKDADVAHAATSICRVVFQSLYGYRHTHVVLVVDEVFDEFVEVAKKRAAEEIVGDPFKVSTTVGPLSSKAQYHRAMASIERLAEHPNVTLVTGGCHHTCGTKDGDNSTSQKGYFIEPTIFTEYWRDLSSAAIDEDFDEEQEQDEEVGIMEGAGGVEEVQDGSQGQAVGGLSVAVESRESKAEGQYENGGISEKFSTEATEGTPPRLQHFAVRAAHALEQVPLTDRTTAYGEEEEDYGFYGRRKSGTSMSSPAGTDTSDRVRMKNEQFIGSPTIDVRTIDVRTQHTLVGGGPVLQIIRTRSCNEAAEAANNLIELSMGAPGSSCVSVFTKSIDALSRVSWALRADVVCANRVGHQRDAPRMACGGVNTSRGCDMGGAPIAITGGAPAAAFMLPNLYHGLEEDAHSHTVPALAMSPSYGMRKW